MFSNSDSLLQTGRLLVISVIVFYLNYLFLLPKYFAKGKYVHYTLIALVVLSINYVYSDLTDFLRPEPPNKRFDDGEMTFKEGDRPEFDKPPDKKFDGRILFVVMQSIPMFFFSTIIWFSEDTRKRKQRESSLMNENLMSEMRFLKSQINPHFLFNALNNIYSLSLTHSETAPKMILKLSEMLRHVVYSSNNPVKLEKEINYILNFMDFQRIKVGEEINISFDYSEANPMLELEPMLLIPFVENAFKHSDVENNEDGYIQIILKSESSKIILEVNNTFSQKDEVKDGTGGIGIENVKKRLELSYQNKSQFFASSNENVFSIKLEIDTK